MPILALEPVRHNARMRPFSTPQLNPATETGWRRRWFDIIYRHDSRPSRNFDLLLVYAMTAMGYGGTFVAFTYLAPMLQQITGFLAELLKDDGQSRCSFAQPTRLSKLLELELHSQNPNELWLHQVSPNLVASTASEQLLTFVFRPLISDATKSSGGR